MDRGMVSEKNIAFLKKREGARYIVGTPKSALKKFRLPELNANRNGTFPGLSHART